MRERERAAARQAKQAEAAKAAKGILEINERLRHPSRWKIGEDE